MNFLDHGRLGDVEHVIQSLEVLAPTFETLTTKTRLVHPIGLEHRTHRPIEDDDAIMQHALHLLNFVQFSFHVHNPIRLNPIPAQK